MIFTKFNCVLFLDYNLHITLILNQNFLLLFCGFFDVVTSEIRFNQSPS